LVLSHVEDFRRDVLQVLSSDEGERNLSGIREYLRSLPVQKHEAVAITFHKDITNEQRNAIIDRACFRDVIKPVETGCGIGLTQPGRKAPSLVALRESRLTAA